MKVLCEFETYFEGYYCGELSPAEELTLQKHLLTCPTCPQKIDEFYAIHSLLGKYHRPPPAKKMLELYHQQVNLSYGKESISQKLNLLIYRLTSSRSPVFRFAQLIMLIATGIIAGWILFSSPEPQIVYHSGYPSQSLIPVGQKDVDYVYYYLRTSEILLLEIENNIDDPEFFLDGELAETLLHKTYRARDIASQLNNVKLLNFIVQMDMLLSQIVNTEEDELKDFLGTIKKVIKDRGLISEIRILKNTITLPQTKQGT